MGAFEDNSGKVSAKVFKEDLLNLCGAIRQEVVVGPQFGVDTALVDLGDGNALAISSDPLSLIPSLGMEVSAWLSVHLLANDLSTTGFSPQFAQFVLNLPTELSRGAFNEYWAFIHGLCEEIGIAITGGHTGQIPGQNSSISGGGTMFLKAPKNQILTSQGAKAGDVIILTKHAAISSSSLMAMAFPQTVKESLGVQIQEKASSNFWNLSVLPEALIASQTLIPNEELNAMHDVTEGGVLGALMEMAEASGLGFYVEKEKIPVPEEVSQVTQLFGIDPLISIGAGAMLMAVKKGSEAKLLTTLKKKGIQATAIGRFTAEKTKLMEDSGKVNPVNFEGKDPYWEAFFKALQTGMQ